MSELYILDSDGNPKEEKDILKWGKWFEGDKRRVALDKIGDVSVSTVFLGIAHGDRPSGPVLFETMIFGGDRDQECERYTSRKDALKKHKEIVASLR